MTILIKDIQLNSQKTDILIKDNLINKIAQNIETPIDGTVIDGSKQAVLPGLMNMHTHAAMSLLKGYADDMPLKIWLEDKIWPREAKLSKKHIYWGTKLAILEMIKTGTTCFFDMYWHPETIIQAVEEMGIRAVIAPAFIDTVNGDDKGKKLLLDLLNQKFSSRIELALGPHAIYTVKKDNLLWLKNLAEERNLKIHIHLSETELEVKNCLKKHNMKPVEYLDSIKFLGPNIFTAHSIWLSNKEINILEAKDVKLIHCPASNMKLASGVFPYTKLNKKENVLLGTDGSASNNNLDMWEEMKLASLLQKISTQNPETLSALECLNMSTTNPAQALALNCGEIKEGNLADLILINLNNITLTPNHNLISNLVYSANGSVVDTVIIDGKIIMKKRIIAEEEAIKEQINKI